MQVITCLAGVADEAQTEPNYSTAFEQARIVANMQSNTLNELSGLVASKANPGLFWAHNDSGDQARVFLIHPATGKIKLEVRLEEVKATDFEDITLRNVGGKTYVVVGDIGDNRGVRKQLALHQFEEPLLRENTLISVPNKAIQTMFIRYAEGARDAETLMSTNDGGLIIITKRESSNFIYQFNFKAGSTQTLTAQSRINIKDITAGDAHTDGRVILRTYGQIYYWPSSTRQISERLSQEAPELVLTTAEPQGEAIAWDLEQGFYSIPEKPFFFEQTIAHYPAPEHSALVD